MFENVLDGGTYKIKYKTSAEHFWIFCFTCNHDFCTFAIFHCHHLLSYSFL